MEKFEFVNLATGTLNAYGIKDVLQYICDRTETLKRYPKYYREYVEELAQAEDKSTVKESWYKQYITIDNDGSSSMYKDIPTDTNNYALITDCTNFDTYNVSDWRIIQDVLIPLISKAKQAVIDELNQF